MGTETGKDKKQASGPSNGQKPGSAAGTAAGLNGVELIGAIRRRLSVRNYDLTALSEEDYRSIEQFVAEADHMTGPFGGRTRVEIIRITKDITDKGIKLGTYGMIRNPRAYLAGIIGEESKHGLLDFGYAFEKLVIFLTARGIGTCWLGGTFNRSSFEKELEMGAEEKIPCITPIGYPKEKQGFMSSAVRYMVKADQKKGWEELFCDSAFGQPLTEQAAGTLAVPVEMVRLGPSASNKQPWRLVVSKDRRNVHFYLAHTPKYSEKMQTIDMGIAMCHFELACQATGLQGQWREADPGLTAPDARTEYMVSWELSGE
ncbi:MAG: nitroreductase [Paenibacillaceae bacterium]|jgi:nitroreductase|nr:nitroreductase [Paenibacillaceae bacterium]